ncbi:dolichol kinase isoform X1 [Schistocerca cancellata]|uniref:dolichol kinase isoform X1 n=2 Tax=Schistocerca cancellata TaxID=274614 RepID=UPI002119267A|nr:dolichol kinase isoform X1 [Schistocerca cancellata]
MGSRLQAILMRDKYNTRPGASTGEWLISLLPMAVVLSTIKTHNPNYLLMTFSAGLLAAAVWKLIRISLCENYTLKHFDVYDVIPGAVIFLLLKLQKTSIPLCFIGSVLGSYAYTLGIPTILTHCPKYFTFGEAGVIVQSFLTFLFSAAINIPHFCNMTSLEDIDRATVILQVGLVGVTVICLGLWLVPALRATVGFYSICASVLIGLVIFPLHIIMGASPVMWIIQLLFADVKTILMVCYWIACCAVAVAAIAVQIQAGKHASTATRKSFHILVVAVYVPGLIGTYCLLYLASGIVLALFVMLEAMRLLHIPPLHVGLQQGFELFADEKDAGGGALTPMYLLTGVSLPLWLHPAAVSNYLPSSFLAGLLAVGIGDTAASAFGSWIGRHRWPNSVKTIEGTVACILSQIFLSGCLMALGYLDASVASVSKLVMSVVLTSLLEAKTDQVDNLVLPLFMYCILEL